MGAGYGFWAFESQEPFKKRRRRDRRQPGASNSNSIKKRFGMVAKEERQMCPEEAYIRIS